MADSHPHLPYNQDSPMVTTPTDNLTYAPPVERRLWPRLVFGLVMAVLLILAGAAAYFYSVARSALPQLDGVISLAGLSAPVDVIRDPRGVPWRRVLDERRRAHDRRDCPAYPQG